MELEQFERELKRLIGEPTEQRPFVCEGSPLVCKAFVVGIEPATSTTESFWDFWRTGYGFQKSQWQMQYARQRKARGKTETSPTRRNLEHLLRGADGVSILETNVYSVPRERFDRSSIPSTEALEFLLATVAPKLLFIHGGPAVAAMRKLKFPADIAVIVKPHLSYQTGEEKARSYGMEIAQRLETMA